ncbi:hypothetical protein BB559_004382 [Furculomyces boomerangus]|uniref:Protein kinase domain-containing protein n=2 Tax=Furculomyces boomerangus TaxID=61424 RepID=A0A2T9YF89_9FUNG|nr:hypothetical protein BB559_004382 [Furculomyces boomerangus]
MSKSKIRLPPSLDVAYRIVRDVGQGAYGFVCQAEHRESKQMVAIKKVTRVSEKEILAKRCLREIKLLRHFEGHDNIISLLNIEITDRKNFNEVYLIQELMEADLHQIIRSGQALTDPHFQYFIYQICRGLKYIHSANVLHRDLKPGNLLVNADCSLRICDFGLARGYSEVPDANIGFLTEYVATRWYRAPEIMLSFQSYTRAIDMWSVGCILAELLGGKALFKGRDYVDQLNQIINILGTPDDETLQRIGSERAQMYIKSLPFTQKVPFSRLFPSATPNALDLLEKLLDFDPTTRITVEEALEHPYLALYHDVDDEPSCEELFDFSFEAINSVPNVKTMIVNEIIDFRRAAFAQHQMQMEMDARGRPEQGGNHDGGQYYQGSGKSSILRQFTEQFFSEMTGHTIGVEFGTRIINVDGTSNMGYSRSRSVTQSYYRASIGTILVYDITNRESFEQLDTWYNDAKRLTAENSIFIVIGNKADCSKLRQVSLEEGKEYAETRNMRFFEASAKTGDHVDDVFVLVAREVLKMINEHKLDISLPDSGVQSRIPVSKQNTSSVSLKENNGGSKYFGKACCW